MIMEIILEAVGIMLFLWLYLYFTGLFFYKMGHAESIEEGAGEFITSVVSEGMRIFRFLFKIFRPICGFLGDAFYNEWTGHDLPKKLINAELILLKEEVPKLVERFKNSPYIVPSLSRYVSNSLGVLWLDIKAMGLIPLYQGLTRSDICGMAENIIQNFYLETRGRSVKIFIKVASPTRLYFAIPLSEEAEEYLEKQEEVQAQENHEEENWELFQEEILEEETGDLDNWL